MTNTDKQLDLLKEYMAIYAQLLPYCFQFGGLRINKYHIFSFDYFKNNHQQIMAPEFKESVLVSDYGEAYKNNCAGMGISDGMAFRTYNYWIGCKHYPKTNKFTIRPEYVSMVCEGVIKRNSI